MLPKVYQSCSFRMLAHMGMNYRDTSAQITLELKSFLIHSSTQKKINRGKMTQLHSYQAFVLGTLVCRLCNGREHACIILCKQLVLGFIPVHIYNMRQLRKCAWCLVSRGVHTDHVICGHISDTNILGTIGSTPFMVGRILIQVQSALPLF